MDSEVPPQIRNKEKRMWFRFTTSQRHETSQSYTKIISQTNAVTIITYQVMDLFCIFSKNRILTIFMCPKRCSIHGELPQQIHIDVP